MDQLPANHFHMPDHNQWPAFTIPGDDTSPAQTDLSYLLEKPAGATGPVCILDGHLATGDGRRLRLWGYNFTARACLPSFERAPLIARHLAKYGVNCIRLHFMDLRWPTGLIMRSLNPKKEPSPEDILTGNQAESTRRLDPEALARLDYFIACLKEQGIYVDLNLNVARQFTEADGLPEAEWLGFAKGLTYFIPRLVELQKEYAAQLLGHVNAFTGTRYADEPAVALVELVNENSLLESWLCDRLNGSQTSPGSTWSDIPPYYAAELDRRWNVWLSEKYPNRESLASAWGADLERAEDPRQGTVRRLRKAQFPTAITPRFTDEATFYAVIEQTWFEEMNAFLVKDVGVKQIILASSDHNQGTNNALHLRNLARFEITDGHYYWQHPEFPGTKGWSRDNWWITNTPMVDDPDRSVIARVSRSKVKGKPYLVSETNLPFPNDYAAGFLPILAAYARFQDWDGIFLYTYDEDFQKETVDEGGITTFFNISKDPVKVGESVAAALAFLRGDVKPARQAVERNLSSQTLVESQLMPLKEAPFMVPHLPGRLALMHQVCIAGFDAETSTPKAGEIEFDPVKIISDTGELHWNATDTSGRVFIDTPRWQVVIGRAGEMSTTNLAVQLTTPYAAIQLISLDGEVISRSSRLLLVTTARVANTSMRWQDSSRQSLGPNFGHAPTRIEPVTGNLVLAGLENAKKVQMQKLDGYCQPVGDHHLFADSKSGWQISLGAGSPGIWHLILIDR